MIFYYCYGCRYSFTKAFCIAFVMTFFSVFDVPVFWPILLCYWIVLFVLTMRRQIAHMIKYKYIPLNLGKQVFLCLIFLSSYLFVHQVLKKQSLIYFVLFAWKITVLMYYCFNMLQKYGGKKSSASSSGSRAD